MGLRIDSSSSPGKTPCCCLPACVNHGETFTGLLSLLLVTLCLFLQLIFGLCSSRFLAMLLVAACVFVCMCVRVCVFSLLVVSTDYWIYKNFFKIRFGKKPPRFLQVCSVFPPRRSILQGHSDRPSGHSSYESLFVYSFWAPFCSKSFSSALAFLPWCLICY